MNFDSRIEKVTINTGDREIPTLDLGANEDLTIRIWLDVDGNIEHLSPQWGYFGQVNVDVIQPVVITNTTTESYKNLCDCSEETHRHKHRTWTSAYFPGSHWVGYEFFKCIKSKFAGVKHGN